MPQTNVVFYQDDDGSIPVLEWIDGLPLKIKAKIAVGIEQLAEFGHELRRPAADYLRNDIYELRVRFQSVNYRVLYFFHKDTQTAAILAVGLTKESKVPDRDINLAIARKANFEQDPAAHTPQEEE